MKEDKKMFIPLMQLPYIYEHVKKVSELNCPKAYGFEGPETFPDCGECVVCNSRKLVDGFNQKHGKL